MRICALEQLKRLRTIWSAGEGLKSVLEAGLHSRALRVVPDAGMREIEREKGWWLGERYRYIGILVEIPVNR